MADTGAPDILPAGLTAALLTDPPVSMIGLAMRWLLIDTERGCRIAAMACTQNLTELDPDRRLRSTPAGSISAEFHTWLRGPGTSTAEDIALRVLTLDQACSITGSAAEYKQVLKLAEWLYGWFTGGRTRRPRTGSTS